MGDVLFCSDDFWDARGDELVAIDPTIEVVRLVGDEHVTPGDLERVTIAIFSPDLYPLRSRQFMAACVRCPNLQWFQGSFAGTDHPVFQSLIERGVQFNTGSGATAPAIAETVIMYLLALSRDLPAMLRDQAQRHWNQRRVVELAGRRLGIVGFGAIGHEVATRAEGLGMHVVGLRRTPDPTDRFETWSNDRFVELLEWADAVVVAAPLTDATRGMFDADAFARMKPGSWFVNVGRGPIVDEAALIDALVTGHLGGAGLDVFETEPLPVESPLWELPNVIVTAHCSGDSDPADERAVDIIMENVRRRAAGEPLLNQVD
ncbi:MAG: hydroxyacid dehydrogenase [Acidimicrobiaceae bacterium]|nr:hydroxyacid dehydrogenase [Acidimicrobiaceae bacterium]